MNTASVRLIQTRLAELGHYHHKIDGQRGKNTHKAVKAALEARAADMPAGWRDWSDKRKSIGFLQLWCHDEGIDAGDIDGWWGPQTEFAFDILSEKRETGNRPVPWRDIEPSKANPHGFPNQSQAALTSFYGPHGVPDGRRPPMRKVACPWVLKIAWNLNQTRSFIWCHEQAADSLAEVLEKVHAHYGDAELARLRLDHFGGDYNPRKMRGGTAWSTHSWGIAIDWDPDHNRWKWGRDQATLDGPEYEDWWGFWEAAGWVSLGRIKNFDWMHVQAARVS